MRIVRPDAWLNILFKYRSHQDQELFERAYGHIRQYY